LRRRHCRDDHRVKDDHRMSFAEKRSNRSDY